MKTLPTLLLLIAASAAQSQEYFNISVNFDGASVKEKTLNFGAEIEYSGRAFYAKAGLESFALDPHYLDVHGGVGVNVYSGMFDNVRTHAGIRLGRIWREDVTVPLFGVEAGVDVKIAESLRLGIVGTYDSRTEGDFLGYDRFWRASGKIKLTYNFKTF